MNEAMLLALIPDSVTIALLSATIMMTVVGLVTAVLLARVSVQSWRLQSLLVAAVLLQGVMLVRTPIHLGLLPASSAAVNLDSAHAVLAADHANVPNAPPGDAVAQQTGPLLARQADALTGSAWLSSLRNLRWTTLLSLVWLAGMIVWSSLALGRYLRMIHLTRQLRPAPDPWRRAWDRLRKGRKPRCQMLVSQSVGPLMLRRPLGYDFIVPESYWRQLNDDQRRGVMLHELAHLDRRDVWRQFFACVVATIHWFNPVAWWALRPYEQAAELACDHRVTLQGQRASAGFASALVQLVQWHQISGTEMAATRGLGWQAMAAPPLTTRVSRLLKPDSTGDSMMKRIVLVLFAMGLVGAALVQIKLTADETKPAADQEASSRIYVLQEATKEQLNEVIERLDRTDETTTRFAALTDSTAGEMAIAGYLNALQNRERDNARVEAVPRYLAKYFDKTSEEKYKVRADQVEMLKRWEEKSARLQTAFEQAGSAMTEMATRIDTSTDTGAMMKRLLEDPQGPAALLLFEMKGGGDAISRYLSAALGKILVDRGDGSFQIVESRRAEAQQQVEKLAAAERVRQKLVRELPLWADEFVTSDEQHQKFVRYLKDPTMATVVAMALMQESKGNPGLAVEKLYEGLEKASTDTAAGLKVTDPGTWQKLEEIFVRVDRVGGLLTRVQERLAEVADTLSRDDPLAARLAKEMQHPLLAAVLAVELPYASADVGEQLRVLLSEVMSETSDNKLVIRPDKEEEVGNKVAELLRVCRAVRRYVRTIDDVLQQMEDQEFVTRLGDAGRYLMLSEIQRFGESHRPNPIELLKKDLLAESDAGKFRVRDERRELVRQLIEQAEKVRAEEANDDF